VSDLENNILSRLFGEMDEAIQKLNRLAQASKTEFLGHHEKVDATKYNFIVAIEAMIDICNRIVSKERFGQPQDYSGLIRLMLEKDVLDEELAKRLIRMVKFRNMLVHLYWKVEDEMLYEYLRSNLNDFKEFKASIRHYLRRDSSLRSE